MSAGSISAYKDIDLVIGRLEEWSAELSGVDLGSRLVKY